MHVVMDTGSSDFWVKSNFMTIPPNGDIYNTTLSTTAEPFDQTFGVSYATGSADGVVWLDTLSIDAGDGSLVITGNPIECAVDLGGPTNIFDGILGLSMVGIPYITSLRF